MSITMPQGFVAAGVAAGIKETGAPDLALIVNQGPSRAAAGVFTSNRVVAAPVTWSRQALADGRISAVILNSGGANACTGPAGRADTERTAAEVSALLDIPADEVAVCSTGLIGTRLPMEHVLAGAERAAAALSTAGGEDAAIAIMTTDAVHKTAVVQADGWSVVGMAKGAGMLAPGLATMLVVLTTDADVPAATLDAVLRDAVAVTFDRIDSDGCMSTNDTVLLLSSGASTVRPADRVFAQAVREVCADLARRLIADAEGATKEIRIDVVGAASEQDAVDVGRSIARNNLFKCALYGEDPNWGRVLSAIGTTQAQFDPDLLNVAINDVWVCKGGTIGEDRSGVDLTGRDVVVTADLSAGSARATIWTNDLSVTYVHENSAYAS
ncbi:bifunctional glutamate N-acetyltransferase/amino-acid acetyltransferase ArgJ [Streptomyces sp. NPDC049813]|uniref:bifunctional glutamate N-acetyltransferase/amino-acid acetyltransferase ArgJ n=1 Tax=Streptomyces sp. NPDC049813 TaxID=3365597 RepID=UPI0037A26A27